MTAAAWTTLALMALMFVLLISNKLPIWLVFIGTLTVAMTLKLAPPAALLKGYSNSGVITVAALYPVAAGMYATGAISLLSERLIGFPKSLTVAQLKIFIPVSIASGFLYNTPLVAMMIPVVRDLSRRTGLKSSKLFMGLSFVTLLGGTTTLLGTSANLIIAGLVAESVAKGELAALKPLGLFDPMWIGVPATLTGIAFMILIGSRLLPDRTSGGDNTEKRTYRSEFLVEESSKLIGKTLDEIGFANPVGFILDSLSRNGTSLEKKSTLKLEAGDLITVMASADRVADLWTTIGLIPAYATKMEDRRHKHQLVEVVLAPRSPANGHTVDDLPLPDSAFELMLVGVSRNGRAPLEPLKDFRLEAGDAGVIEVNDFFFYENRREVDFILTKRLEGFRVQRIDRAVVALVITVAMVVLAVTGVMSMLNAALLASFAMLVSGCLTIDRLWQSIDWHTIVILGSAIGLEAAVTASGLAKHAADLVTTIGGRSPMMALGAVYVGTVLLTNVISNAASAVLMFSVAVSLANNLGVSFLPFAIILMSAASTTFINPAGFQTNLMVQEPGGYLFSDFVRVGVPLTLVLGVVVLWLASQLYTF